MKTGKKLFTFHSLNICFYQYFRQYFSAYQWQEKIFHYCYKFYIFIFTRFRLHNVISFFTFWSNPNGDFRSKSNTTFLPFKIPTNSAKQQNYTEETEKCSFSLAFHALERSCIGCFLLHFLTVFFRSKGVCCPKVVNHCTQAQLMCNNIITILIISLCVISDFRRQFCVVIQLSSFRKATNHYSELLSCAI